MLDKEKLFISLAEDFAQTVKEYRLQRLTIPI
jgi:hypothetical protein